MLTEKDGKLIYTYDAERLVIEAWGNNSFRVRATKLHEMPENEWALIQPSGKPADAICISEDYAEIINGKIKGIVDKNGKITFKNQKDHILLEEYVRDHNVGSPLSIEAREFKPVLGGNYSLTLRFESDPEERIYGLGQYQQPYLNVKGCELELAQRNTQASVPFAVSSLGYGFLWNNPAVGRVSFARNITTWTALSTNIMDYWITAGDTPADILENYGKATGTVPMMPEWAMGFWQCKLRYQTQEELMTVAREYQKRNVPLSVIVIDAFHWTCEGEWKFDPEYWPDPQAMVDELNQMGVELMVSVWPTVDQKSENYKEMEEKGFLVRTDRGYRTTMEFFTGNTVYYDATNPGARDYLWEKFKKNYYKYGIKIFWLDLAEPEYVSYNFDLYSYYLGSNLEIGNIYPVMYAKTFYDGMQAEGQENILNLLRCAWAGSQRYGALVWSGDVGTNFESMRNQIVAGLNMGMAGIPWWTTDIGGFNGGNADDPAFRECFTRWFEYAAFCPVMRLHGYRDPHSEPLGKTGGGVVNSGGPNEIWSYGDEVYEICKDYIEMRRNMKPYITKLMEQAHEKGSPVMRPMFYEFPHDKRAWQTEDQYMFGPDILVAPIMYANCRQRDVYLPEGEKWRCMWTGEINEGGRIITAAAPIERIPVFIRDGADVSPL